MKQNKLSAYGMVMGLNEKGQRVTNPKWLAKLMGTEKFYNQIIAGLSKQDIKKIWGLGLAKYKETRRKYLLCPE